jgi:hypothetical protein
LPLLEHPSPLIHWIYPLWWLLPVPHIQKCIKKLIFSLLMRWTKKWQTCCSHCQLMTCSTALNNGKFISSSKYMGGRVPWIG